jgi:transposase-like protein
MIDVDAAEALAEKGLTRKEIARRLGVSGSRVSQVLKPLHPRRDWPDSVMQQALEMKSRGKSYGTISVKLGVPQSTLWDWVNGGRRRGDGASSPNSSSLPRESQVRTS